MRLGGAIAIAALALATAGSPAVADDPPAELMVCLQPLGTLGAADQGLLAPVGRGIERVFGFTVKTLPAVELPAAAWYAPRKRYRAERLLDHLVETVLPDSGCRAIIGFAAVDISTTKDDIPDWGVLGLAYVDGSVGVVSSYRMKKGKARRRKVMQRAVKVTNHELGHVLGLPHMDGGPACMMNDAHGTIRTVDQEHGGMCEDERAPIAQKLGVAMPPAGAPDWDWIATGRAR
jgi:archaemetzincin